ARCIVFVLRHALTARGPYHLLGGEHAISTEVPPWAITLVDFCRFCSSPWSCSSLRSSSLSRRERKAQGYWVTASSGDHDALAGDIHFVASLVGRPSFSTRGKNSLARPKAYRSPFHRARAVAAHVARRGPGARTPCRPGPAAGRRLDERVASDKGKPCDRQGPRFRKGERIATSGSGHLVTMRRLGGRY